MSHAVLTIDQRSSRASDAIAERHAKNLNRRFGKQLTLGFGPTVGDEIQGVTQDPEVVVTIILDAIRDRKWWVGLGIGRIETPLAKTAARSRGEAFYLAREAVEDGKTRVYGFAIRAPNREHQEDIEAVLGLLGFVLQRRGPTTPPSKRWEAVDLAEKGLPVTAIAQRLGIKHQSVSERLRTSGFDEERAGRRLAIRLTARALAGVGS
jgi:hypothetical protein